MLYFLACGVLLISPLLIVVEVKFFKKLFYVRKLTIQIADIKLNDMRSVNISDLYIEVV